MLIRTTQSLLILTCVLIVSSFAFSTPLCELSFLAKDPIATFKDSRVGKIWSAQMLAESLRVLRRSRIRIPDRYQFDLYVQFNKVDRNGSEIDGLQLLSELTDIQAKLENGAVHLLVPFNRFDEVLLLLSRPQIASAVSDFGAVDRQLYDKTFAKVAQPTLRRRSTQVLNQQIDQFVALLGGDNPMSVKELVPRASRLRFYVTGAGKFLSFPKTIEVKHDYPAKLDPFVQIGSAAVLSRVLRLNSGLDVFHQTKGHIQAPFLFRQIQNFDIRVVEVTNSGQSEIPKQITFEVDVTGIEAISPDSVSWQHVKVSVAFESTKITTPHIQIDSYEFKN